MATLIQPTIVSVSGGFDPLHIGHLHLMEKAKDHGDKLVVILNDDEWLMRKKGFVFMPLKERAEMLYGFRWVDDVVIREPRETYDVIHMLAKLDVHIFANGGDRKTEQDIPEAQICKEKDIKMIFGVGDLDKAQASTWLIQNFLKQVEGKIDRIKETGKAL
ncbi:MAG TPA: adenylyltransferase/cytidyltransferase family protein [Candidatus Paceibacterota bacterium]